jgi:parallel beta-helix repeat protein
LQQFLAYERQLGRDDLVIPLYYQTVPALEDARRQPDASDDPLIQALAPRQPLDWRTLRQHAEAASPVRAALDKLAARILSIRDAVPPKASRVSSTAPASPETPVPDAPPRLMVDPWGRRGYNRIGAAIAAAAPGSDIVIQPGFYQETLVLNKPLRLLGEGEPEEIIIEAAEQPVLRFQANIGQAVNLTLWQIGAATDDESVPAVDIGRGRLNLFNCTITSEGGDGIIIYDGADPVIERCSVLNCKQNGIFVFDRGRGRLRHNLIGGNGGSGIFIARGCRSGVVFNRIWGHSAGITLEPGCGGVFAENDLRENDQPRHGGLDAGVRWLRNKEE